MEVEERDRKRGQTEEVDGVPQELLGFVLPVGFVFTARRTAGRTRGDVSEDAEEFDEVLGETGAATFPGAFVVEGVEAEVGVGAEDSKIMGSSGRFSVPPPQLGFVGFRGQDETTKSGGQKRVRDEGATTARLS